MSQSSGGATGHMEVKLNVDEQRTETNNYRYANSLSYRMLSQNVLGRMVNKLHIFIHIADMRVSTALSFQ